MLELIDNHLVVRNLASHFRFIREFIEILVCDLREDSSCVSSPRVRRGRNASYNMTLNQSYS